MTVTDDDPFGTTLITQLANEFFSESRRAVLPYRRHFQVLNRPRLPHRGDGQRCRNYARSDRTKPAAYHSIERASYPDLAGGYPSATPDTHPPVHPGLQGPRLRRRGPARDPVDMTQAPERPTPSASHDATAPAHDNIDMPVTQAQPSLGKHPN